MLFVPDDRCSAQYLIHVAGKILVRVAGKFAARFPVFPSKPVETFFCG